MFFTEAANYSKSRSLNFSDYFIAFSTTSADSSLSRALLHILIATL